MPTTAKNKFIKNRAGFDTSSSGFNRLKSAVSGVSIATKQDETLGQAALSKLGQDPSKSSIREGNIVAPEQREVIEKTLPNASKRTTNVIDTSEIDNTSATTPRDAFVQNTAANKITDTSGTATPTPTLTTTTDTPSGVRTPSGTVVNPDTGALIAGPKADPNASLRSAFESFFASTKETDAERKAREHVENLVAQGAEDFAKAQEMGDTMKFAQGKSKLISDAANRAINAATGALDVLTGARMNEVERQAARFEFEQSLAEAPVNEPIKIGNQLVVKNPDGTYEAVFTAKEGQDVDIVTAGGRQLLVDKNSATVIGDLGASEGALKRGSEGADDLSKERETQVSTISLINSIINNADLSTVSGTSRLGISARLAGTAGVRSQLAQLEALTSLENRSKLKGSGAISDFEAGMLSNAANALNFAIQDDGRISMSDEEAVQNLKNIRGILMLKAGETVNMIVTDPATNESRQFLNQSRQDVDEASLSGFIIDFE